MRKAILNKDNVVENIIKADDGFSITGKILVDAENAEIGSEYKDGKFTAPPAPPAREIVVPEPTDDEILVEAIKIYVGASNLDLDEARESLKQAKIDDARS